MDRQLIGKRLRTLRGDRSMSEVAKAVGCVTSCIGNYEAGIRTPPDDMKIKLAKYYKTTVNKIFFAPENTNRVN